MTGEIVNLRGQCKRRAREDMKLKAEEYRRRFGGSRPESEKHEAEAISRARHLDGHNRDS
jgi:hypothetical protein